MARSNRTRCRGRRRDSPTAPPRLPGLDATSPATDRGASPTLGGDPRGKRLVLPSSSCRRRELPLGREPVLPVGADGLSSRQPAMLGVDRDLLAGRAPVLSRRAGGRRDAPWLGPVGLGRARRRCRRCFALAGAGGSLTGGLALEHARSLIFQVDPSGHGAPRGVSTPVRHPDPPGREAVCLLFYGPSRSLPWARVAAAPMQRSGPPRPPQGHRAGLLCGAGGGFDQGNTRSSGMSA